MCRVEILGVLSWLNLEGEAIPNMTTSKQRCHGVHFIAMATQTNNSITGFYSTKT